MGQDTILGTDTIKDALKTKVNNDIAELFAAVAALAAGGGILISSNDTTAGYLNGKLVAGEGIDLTEGDDGADERLTVAGEDASTTNKGIVELATDAETLTGTDTTRACTPANITAKMAELGVVGGAGSFTTIAASGNVTLDTLTASKPVFTDGSKNLVSTGTMPVDQGGTGQTTYTNGQLLIGNTTGNTLAKATLTGTANQITVTNGAGTITLSIPANFLIPTVTTIPNEGLHILDTNASHDLIVKPGSDLSADRILTITTGDAARTLTIPANTTLFASGTVMLFGQNAAPTGWTRKADWQDNAMLCYAASGNIGSGGVVNPQSTHTHTGPNHTHSIPHDGWAPNSHVSPGSGDHIGINASELVDAYEREANGDNTSGEEGTGATGANTAPHYQEVIAAIKD